MRRLSIVAALVAALLVLAGCGGGEAGSTLGEAASVAPADARALTVVRTDEGSEQTRRALEHLARFPAVSGLDVDLEREVLPALGDEAAHVVLAGGEQVWLARPEDEGRLEELLGRLQKRPVTREVGGWTAIAADEEALDALQRGREQGSLADDDAFTRAFDGLGTDGLARVWTSERAEGPLRGAVAVVHAEADGLRLEGHRAALEDVEPYHAGLLDRVPAGAAVVASFRGREGLEDRLRLLPFLSALDLPELGGTLEGEGVLFVQPGALVPELTLLTEVEDEAAASRAAAHLLRRLGATPREDDSAQFGPLTVRYGARDGVFALTSSAEGLGVLDEAAADVRDDPRFERAAERAGLPEETTGFLYLRADELAPMLALLGMLGGKSAPPELRENLEPLGSVLLYGGRDGDRQTLDGFVEIPSR